MFLWFQKQECEVEREQRFFNVTLVITYPLRFRMGHKKADHEQRR